MNLLFALIVGLLYACGTYLILKRSLIQLILGLVLLSHGANLLIFSSGTFRGSVPPIVAVDALAPPAGAADPVPQALILTAIVINFAVIAFALVLFHRVYKTFESDNPDDLKERI